MVHYTRLPPFRAEGEYEGSNFPETNKRIKRKSSK